MAVLLALRADAIFRGLWEVCMVYRVFANYEQTSLLRVKKLKL